MHIAYTANEDAFKLGHFFTENFQILNSLQFVSHNKYKQFRVLHTDKIFCK